MLTIGTILPGNSRYGIGSRERLTRIRRYLVVFPAASPAQRPIFRLKKLDECPGFGGLGSWEIGGAVFLDHRGRGPSRQGSSGTQT